MRHHFVGYPAFIAKTGNDHCSIRVCDRARRQPALHELSSLLASACEADPAHVPGILEHAKERLEALKLAAFAGEEMFRQVSEALIPPTDPMQATGS